MAWKLKIGSTDVTSLVHLPTGVNIDLVVNERGTARFALKSNEIDFDYRARVSQDLLLDDEVFSYTAQNTGKHSYSVNGMANSWTAGQLTTNSGSLSGSGIGTQVQTYAFFPYLGTTTVSVDAEISFSIQPTANTFIEWGVGLPGAATTAPTDGVFFRLSSAGLQGIASFNGTEVSTGIFPLSQTLLAELPVTANVLISHSHWDHIQGLPFFTPLFIKGSRVRLHGATDPDTGNGIEHVMGVQLQNSYFPVSETQMDATIGVLDPHVAAIQVHRPHKVVAAP